MAENVRASEQGGLEEKMEHMKEDAGRTLEKARTEAAHQLDRVERMIRRNPLASASIAAGLGFFLAVLARR